MQGGTIQATVLVAPFDLQSEKMGFRRLLWLGKVMDLPQGGLGVHEKRLQEQPDEIVRVMKAVSRGIQFIKTSRDETIRFMVPWLNLERSVAAGAYPLVVESLADFGIVEDSVIESAMEAARFQGRSEKAVPLSQVRDWSFAQKARAELAQKKAGR